MFRLKHRRNVETSTVMSIRKKGPLGFLGYSRDGIHTAAKAEGKTPPAGCRRGNMGVGRWPLSLPTWAGVWGDPVCLVANSSVPKLLGWSGEVCACTDFVH